MAGTSDFYGGTVLVWDGIAIFLGCLVDISQITSYVAESLHPLT